MKKTATSYTAVCETLLAGKPVTCTTTGTVFEALPAPSLIIIDVSYSMYSYLIVRLLNLDPSV